MITVSDVNQYIQDNVLHSKLWDNASTQDQTKAVNQAKNMLLKFLPDHYPDSDSLPVEDVAEQALWLLKLDDSMQRAEMGALMITVDGISIQLKDMDRTISPKILAQHGLSSIRRRRVGSYSVGIQDTYRVGNQYSDARYYRR